MSGPFKAIIISIFTNLHHFKQTITPILRAGAIIWTFFNSIPCKHANILHNWTLFLLAVAQFLPCWRLLPACVADRQNCRWSLALSRNLNRQYQRSTTDIILRFSLNVKQLVGPWVLSSQCSPCTISQSPLSKPPHNANNLSGMEELEPHEVPKQFFSRRFDGRV